MQKTTFVKAYTDMREEALRELRGAPLSIYFALAFHMNWSNEAFPSLETLSRETGYSIKQVERALKFLVEKGYITIKRKGFYGRGLSTIYQVNHYVHVGRGNPDDQIFGKKWTSMSIEEDKEEEIYRSISSSSSYMDTDDQISQEKVDIIDDKTPQQPDEEVEELWEKVKEKSKDEMTFSNYNCWVQETKGIKLFDSTILVGAPSELVKEHLQRFIYGVLIKATYKALGKEVEPRFVVLNPK